MKIGEVVLCVLKLPQVSLNSNEKQKKFFIDTILGIVHPLRAGECVLSEVTLLGLKEVKVGNYVPICHMNFYTIFSIHKALWATTASDGEMLQLFRLYPKAVGKLLDENATA